MGKADLRIDWATHAATKYACENWHYSKSVPVPPLVKIGVWEAGKFVGVVIFSRGATPGLLTPFGLVATQGCEYIGPDGKRWHSRMIKKKGWTTVHGKIRSTLAPDQCTRINMPGKYRYLMPLDDEMRARIMPLSKPYPKRAKQAMTGDQPEQRQCDTDQPAPILEVDNG